MEMLQLETFVCLVQQGNFSRAAKQLNVSQPTVTIRIKALEDELGIPLIIRIGHSVKLTPPGQIFFEHIERSLRVLKEGTDMLSMVGDEGKRLSVAGTSNLCTYFLPQILGRLYRTDPNWEMSLTIGHSWEVVEMILDEICHIGIINGYFKHPDVVKIPLFKDPFYLMCYPGHPLATKESITLYDLTDEPIFTYKLGSNMSYMIKSLFRDVKMKTDISIELSDSYTMKQMILEGNGIGFMPWSAAAPEVNAGRLCVLPLILPIPLTRDVNLIVLKKNVELKQVTAFLHEMDKSIRDYEKSDVIQQNNESDHNLGSNTKDYYIF
jgi:DNA-binding transcriptional LysR family regulator